MQIDAIHIAAAVVFALALLHTFCAKRVEAISHRGGPHAGLFHLLGEIEIVFGLWALVLLLLMAVLVDGHSALEYAETRQYTEPIFVFVVMVVAASAPVLQLVGALVGRLARVMPVDNHLAESWLGLSLVPLFGSLITEPAAMTLAALMLAPRVFAASMPERVKYAALGVLFVNISIGGTLTSYAAPPVLMVATTWNWDTAFMASTFGWRAAIAVLVNATAFCWFARNAIKGHRAAIDEPVASADPLPAAPLGVSLIHCGFLVLVIGFAHHPVILFATLLFFLGYTVAYARYQSPLILKEALLVAFFLAGLVVLGGMQQWWLQPIVSSLSPLALFFGATALTALTDNAALTYLGSLIDGVGPASQYMLVAGAVTGGGLTVIANAPNPAGVALLRRGFAGASIGMGALLVAALAPTAVAAVMFLI
ncbi:putative Na+/H+ antiporter [soil metagenome]